MRICIFSWNIFDGKALTQVMFETFVANSTSGAKFSFVNKNFHKHFKSEEVSMKIVLAETTTITGCAEEKTEIKFLTVWHCFLFNFDDDRCVFLRYVS